MGAIQINGLVGELYKFGLNPSEWNIESEGDELVLTHREDPSFRMSGKVDALDQWTELSILSI